MCLGALPPCVSVCSVLRGCEEGARFPRAGVTQEVTLWKLEIESGSSG